MRGIVSLALVCDRPMVHVGEMKSAGELRRRRLVGEAVVPLFLVPGEEFNGRGVSSKDRIPETVINHSGLPRLTLDVDGSVVSTGLRVEGARRGFNPHRRKVPSYYPITAYEANTGQVLRVRNRSGNVHDGKASLAFLGELFEQLAATLQRRPVLEMRMDGAFFHAAVIDLLDKVGVKYAIKVPFWRWLGLRELFRLASVAPKWLHST